MIMISKKGMIKYSKINSIRSLPSPLFAVVPNVAAHR